MTRKPKYSLRQKLNNRLLGLDTYLLGKDVRQRKLKEVITASNNIFSNIINSHAVSEYNFLVAMDIVLRSGFDCIIDVGANAGQFASRVLASGFKGKVISLEPQADVFEKLAIAAESFENWDVHKLGAAEQGGSREFNVYSGNQFSSLHKPKTSAAAEFEDALQLDHTEQIEVVRLDEFVKHNYPSLTSEGSRIFLKTDTQGHDLAVISGSDAILHNVHAIAIELSFIEIYDGAPSFEESLASLRSRGFSPMGFFPINNSGNNFAAVEMDGIFVRH